MKYFILNEQHRNVGSYVQYLAEGDTSKCDKWLQNPTNKTALYLNIFITVSYYKQMHYHNTIRNLSHGMQIYFNVSPADRRVRTRVSVT